MVKTKPMEEGQLGLELASPPTLLEDEQYNLKDNFLY